MFVYFPKTSSNHNKVFLCLLSLPQKLNKQVPAILRQSRFLFVSLERQQGIINPLYLIQASAVSHINFDRIFSFHFQSCEKKQQDLCRQSVRYLIHAKAILFWINV